MNDVLLALLGGGTAVGLVKLATVIWHDYNVSKKDDRVDQRTREAEMRTDIATLKGELIEKTRKIETLQKDLNEALEQKFKDREKIRDLKKEIDDLSDEVRELRKKLGNL